MLRDSLFPWPGRLRLLLPRGRPGRFVPGARQRAGCGAAHAAHLGRRIQQTLAARASAGWLERGREPFDAVLLASEQPGAVRLRRPANALRSWRAGPQALRRGPLPRSARTAPGPRRRCWRPHAGAAPARPGAPAVRLRPRGSVAPALLAFVVSAFEARAPGWARGAGQPPSTWACPACGWCKPWWKSAPPLPARPPWRDRHATSRPGLGLRRLIMTGPYPTTLEGARAA